MKTQVQSLTISLLIYSLLFLLLAGMAFGSEMEINPLPGETSDSNYMAYEDEAYVNDIPFNTKAIADSYNLKQAMDEIYDFEEEAYVDDIPFNTEYVAENYLFNQAMNEEMHFEEEAYVNDIPTEIVGIAQKLSNVYVLAK